MTYPNRPFATGFRHLPALRSIPTRHAELFVPWRADCVREVLRECAITADDFDTRRPHVKAFVRDLAPLAAQDALAGAPDRRLTGLVRALFRRLHGELEASAPAPQGAPAHA